MQNEIYFGYDLLPEATLEHYGIARRSGRYPWGSGEDPYHHGASAPGGRKLSTRTTGNDIISRIKRRRAENEPVRAARRAAAEAKERERKEARALKAFEKKERSERKAEQLRERREAEIKESQERRDKLATEKRLQLEEEARQAKIKYEREKDAAIKSGDPKKIAPYVQNLTDQELRSANERIKLTNEFSDLLAKNNDKGKKRADAALAGLKTMNELTGTGIQMWNNVARIHNAFKEEGEKPFKIIETGGKKDGKKK